MLYIIESISSEYIFYKWVERYSIFIYDELSLRQNDGYVLDYHVL